MVDFKQIENKIVILIQLLQVYLPKETIEDAKDLVIHQEYGVALELICQQLYEFETIIKPEIFDQIFDLASLMEMPSSTYEYLKRT